MASNANHSREIGSRLLTGEVVEDSEGTEDMEGGEYVEGAEHGEGIGRRGSRMAPLEGLGELRRMLKPC